MFEGVWFGCDDGEEHPQLSDAEYAEIMNEPLPAEFAHLKPLGVDPDVFVVQAAQAGPTLQSLALLAAAPVEGLSETGRSLALAELEKVTNLVEALKSALIAAIAGPAPCTRAQTLDDFAAQEVAVATRCSVYAADRKIALARALNGRFAATREVMAGGGISEAQARVMTEAFSHLPEELREELEANLLKFSHRQDLTKFRASIRRWLAKKDPTWPRRAEQARRQVTVEHHALDDGTGELMIRGPLEHTHLINLALAAIAQQTKPELGGTVADRKFAALRDWADAALTGPGAPSCHGMPIRVQMITHPETILGHDETPVEIPGVGMIPASGMRWALADGADLQALLVTKRTGYLQAVDPTIYQIPPQLADLLISRYITSAAPHSNVAAAGCDLDHNMPHPRGPTDEHNVTPFDRRWHRAKTHGKWTTTKNPDTGIITWHSPTGLTIDIDPYNYRTGP